VTLDNQPLEKGLVTFLPKDGGAPGYGQVSNGNFTIQTGTKPGVKAGSYLVTITDMTIPESGTTQTAKLLTPEKYARDTTSDLKAEVKPGANTFSFEMKSTS
jgi:hypothetical protein